VTPGEQPKKLIEVALPLLEINAACKADKDRKTGTIRNLHKWFAPMPLPAWRALLFAALIDDPGDDEKRAYLLDVIKRLVMNGADLPDQDTLAEAQGIIEEQFPDGVPTVMDPFCGGGSTLVEAQRLGLPTFGSDLNPVPVLITRALTETLPKVHGQQPLHAETVEETKRRTRSVTRAPEERLFGLSGKVRTYNGYDGLVRDVTYYAEQIGDQAWEQLKDYYPCQAGETPIAWLWARTCRCPNPACGVETILATSWWLSKKKGDLAWIEPRVVDGVVYLDVISGKSAGEAPDSSKVGRGVFACLGCRATLNEKYLRTEGKSGRLGVRMTAVVVEGLDGMRLYRGATQDEIRAAADVPCLHGVADIPIVEGWRSVNVPLYGITSWADLYSSRQLTTLATFADGVAAVHARIASEGGTEEWATAVSTMLGLALGRLAMSNSSQARVTIRNDGTTTRFNAAFGRNDLPMTWDFPELNPMGDNGTWLGSLSTVLDALNFAGSGKGVVVRADARSTANQSAGLVATDPPYFDAIGYADLSDYFYVWHRRALRNVHPDLYTTVATPKVGELTAIPPHHGNDKTVARDYFISGFTETFRNLQRSLGPGLPLLVVYASKEQKGGKEEETRWSSILTAMVDADLEITGTWPIHGTGSTRMVGQGANVVASYVVMVSRPRPAVAGTCSLADFNRALRRELKVAVRDLQAAGILPVDLAQAAMGPGMQIYSRHREVVDQSGGRVPVEQALRLINAALGEVLDEQEGELDPDSRFAVTWWEKHGWEPASFGEADQLARPQGISVDDVVRAGVATYPKAGFVDLLGTGGMDRNWKPSSDGRPTAWEAVHHLADRLIDGGGEMEAGRLIGELGVLRDSAQALVYRLHDIAAKKGRTRDQERYNALIGSWSDLLAIAATEKANRMDGLF